MRLAPGVIVGYGARLSSGAADFRIQPRSQERLTGPLGIVQVEKRGGLALHVQVADFSGRHRVPVAVYDAALVASYGLPAAAGANVARPVRHEDVEILRRPDAIEQLDPGLVFEPVPKRSGQGLAGRDPQTERREVVTLCEALDREDRRVPGGRVEEDRGLESVDDAQHVSRHAGAARIKHCGGPDVPGEYEVTAEAVDEEELRDRERAVLVVQSEHVHAPELSGQREVGVGVVYAFGLPGRAAGEVERGKVVAVSVRGLERGRLARDPGVPVVEYRPATGRGVRLPTHHDDVLEETRLGRP